MDMYLRSLKIACQKSTIKRAVTLSILVGSMLNLINQGDLLLSGEWSNVNVFKLILTYVTPFMVSVYSTTTALIKIR